MFQCKWSLPQPLPCSSRFSLSFSLSHTHFFFSSELISFLFGNVCVHVYLYQKISLSHLHDIFLKRLLYICTGRRNHLEPFSLMYLTTDNKCEPGPQFELWSWTPTQGFSMVAWASSKHGYLHFLTWWLMAPEAKWQNQHKAAWLFLL